MLFGMRLPAFLILTTAFALLSCKSDSSSTPPAPSQVTFPKSFLWERQPLHFRSKKGTRTPTGGHWVALTPSKIKNGDTPDNGGPDALEHVDDDIQLMQQMDLNSYRFSIEWGRLFQTADATTPDPTALAAYDSEMQKLVAAHITPMVTLQHFALPDWLSDVTQPNNPQGWERPETTDAFVKFCTWAGSHYGSQVDWWVTINEPLVTAVVGYVQGGSPPGDHPRDRSRARRDQGDGARACEMFRRASRGRHRRCRRRRQGCDGLGGRAFANVSSARSDEPRRRRRDRSRPLFVEHVVLERDHPRKLDDDLDGNLRVRMMSPLIRR